MALILEMAVWKFRKISLRIFISPHSVRMQENADQNNSEYEHFSYSD